MDSALDKQPVVREILRKHTNDLFPTFISDQTEALDTCQAPFIMFEKSSETVRMGWSTLLVISACVVDSVTIAYDGSVMGSVNVMPSYNRYFDITTTTKAVNSSATYLGAILMAPFAGIIVDKLGRKQGLFISAVLNVIGAAVTAAAQNTAMFIAGRMIIGIGVGLAQTAAGTYVAETTAPKIRAFALGLYYSCWAIGGFLAAGVSYGVRTPCLIDYRSQK